jgi:O-antigen/teichoic acid export membrane protein
LLGTLAQLGLSQAIVYTIARRRSDFGDTFFVAIWLWLFQSAVAVLGAELILALGIFDLSPMAKFSIRLYLFSIPFAMLLQYLSSAAQGLQAFRFFNAAQLLAGGVYVGSLSAAWLLNVRSAVGVVSFMLAGQALITGSLFIAFVRRFRPVGRFTATRARELLAYGIKSHVANVAWLANGRLDQFIMSGLVSLSDLGHYSVAVSYATVLTSVAAAFATVLFPRVAQQRSYQGRATIWRVVGANLVISVPLALIMGAVSARLLPLLFGQDFQPAVLPAMILLPGSILLGHNHILTDGLRGLGRPIIPSIAEVCGLLATVVGLLLLLPKLGVIGAALSSNIAYFVVALILSVYLGLLSFRNRWSGRAEPRG